MLLLASVHDVLLSQTLQSKRLRGILFQLNLNHFVNQWKLGSCSLIPVPLGQSLPFRESQLESGQRE